MNNLNVLQSLSNNSFIPFPDKTFYNFDGKSLNEYLNSNKPLPKFWDFEGADNKILFEENLKVQPQDWYYRNHRVKYTLNSQGYRTQEFDDIDWAESVVIFGCSYIFGTGVTDESTIPHFLEKILNRPVVNMGIGGSSIQVAFHNSIIMQKKYPPPKAVIYAWTSLSRNTIYSRDDGIVNCGEWNNREMKSNYVDIVTHNLLNILYIRDLWKDKTIMIEYTPFEQTKNVIETVLNDKKNSIVHNWSHKEFDLARDLRHAGFRTNFMMAKKIAKQLKNL
jgi:hypothetical protein